MTMNRSATSPEQLMTIFAERAAGGDATGLIELYEPDGVFEPRRTVGAARKPDRRLAIAGVWGAEHLPRSSSWPSMVGPLPFGTQVFRQLIRPVDGSEGSSHVVCRMRPRRGPASDSLPA